MNDGTLIVYGGAFNPPTIAHVEIIKKIAETYPNNKIYVIPSNDKYITGWKQQYSPIPFEDRLDLLSDAAVAAEEYNEQISYLGIEQYIIASGNTIDTVNYLKDTRYSDVAIVIGYDNLPKIKTWYGGDELLAENEFIVLTRGKHSDSTNLRFHFLQLEGFDNISSTQIRDAYLNNDLKSVKNYVPINVFEYLKEHKDLFKESTNV
jgi:nicotinate-nucleotide adenylyltransferase